MADKEKITTSDNHKISISQDDFDLFRIFLENACGISLGENKRYFVVNRIRSILEEYKITSVKEFISELSSSSNRTLRESVIDAMTTNETLWFRDVYPFDYLKTTLLPKLVVEKNKMFGPIRIWSAACSSGQEPYSISIVIEECKRYMQGELDRGVYISATDLSLRMIEQAKQGQYDKLSIQRGLTSDRLNTYFEEVSAHRWQVKKNIRARVDFKYFNLMDSFITLGKFDVIFCRNVLIYFNAELKQEILRKIYTVLNPGGYLILGSAENIVDMPDMFDMVRTGSGIIYRAT
jgi:chemotaxis protein methyltransferase CheR